MTNLDRNFQDAIQFAAQTDIGMRRKNNQDSLKTMVTSDASYWEERGHLFVVADGMGAHAAGELASKLAVDGIPHAYAKHTNLEPAEALRHSILEVNSQIYDKGRSDPEFKGMGTTCCALLLLPAGAIIGHVGDSRVYRLRNHQLDQLTFDHSLVWEMRAAGQVPDDSAEIHIPKNIITRSLGPHPQLKVDLEGPFPIHQGDTFLLCSDGLTGPVLDKEIGAILDSLPPDEAARMLIDLANLRGGPDNITVIIVRADGSPVAESDAPQDDATTPGSSKILWAVSLVCLFLAVGLFLLGSVFPGVLCVVGAVVTAIVGVLQKFERKEPAGAAPCQPLGRGPYRNHPCHPDAPIVADFGSIASELRATAGQIGGQIDWQPYDQWIAQASTAADEKDFAEAIRSHGRAISFAVAELKKRRPDGRPSDSTVDL